jgi:acyl-CoA thioester hydrolase
MEALTAMGVDMAFMKEHGFGPVLLREECVFRREIKLEDEIHSDLTLRHLSRDHGRFSFQHVLSKADGTYCATLVVEGAWIDTRLRKLCAPPQLASEGLDRIPRSPDFKWLEPN